MCKMRCPEGPPQSVLLEHEHTGRKLSSLKVGARPVRALCSRARFPFATFSFPFVQTLPPVDRGYFCWNPDGGCRVGVAGPPTPPASLGSVLGGPCPWAPWAWLGRRHEAIVHSSRFVNRTVWMPPSGVSQGIILGTRGMRCPLFWSGVPSQSPRALPVLGSLAGRPWAGSGSTPP